MYRTSSSPTNSQSGVVVASSTSSALHSTTSSRTRPPRSSSSFCSTPLPSHTDGITWEETCQLTLFLSFSFLSYLFCIQSSVCIPWVLLILFTTSSGSPTIPPIYPDTLSLSLPISTICFRIHIHSVIHKATQTVHSELSRRPPPSPWRYTKRIFDPIPPPSIARAHRMLPLPCSSQLFPPSPPTGHFSSSWLDLFSSSSS